MNIEFKDEKLFVNGVEYQPKSQDVLNESCFKYCIVRTYSAGVFAGFLKSHKNGEAVLINSRRLWYWDGAASLSQLSQDGVSKPDKCKFPCEVPEMTVLGVIEIIPCTPKAKESIQGVKVWVN